LSLPIALLFSGCMLATQQDIVKLDDDLTQMRKNQADLVTKMSDLSGNLESLNSQLESSQQRMSQLAQKLDDLQADIVHRIGVLGGQVTGTSTQAPSNPNDFFRLSYNDYQSGKFDLALVGFRNLISQYPQSDVTAQAQFYIGECQFAMKNYSGAVQEYDKVVQLYPKNDFAPKALYKKGIAYQQLGQTDNAGSAFRRVVKDYPHSDVAKSARDILKSQ
jgi:tol-pal system protein YbgF